MAPAKVELRDGVGDARPDAQPLHVGQHHQPRLAENGPPVARLLLPRLRKHRTEAKWVVTSAAALTAASHRPHSINRRHSTTTTTTTTTAAAAAAAANTATAEAARPASRVIIGAVVRLEASDEAGGAAVEVGGAVVVLLEEGAPEGGGVASVLAGLDSRMELKVVGVQLRPRAGMRKLGAMEAIMSRRRAVRTDQPRGLKSRAEQRKQSIDRSIDVDVATR